MGDDVKKLQKQFPHKSKEECKRALEIFGSMTAAANAFNREPKALASPAGRSQVPAYAQPYNPSVANAYGQYPPQQAPVYGQAAPAYAPANAAPVYGQPSAPSYTPPPVYGQPSAPSYTPPPAYNLQAVPPPGAYPSVGPPSMIGLDSIPTVNAQVPPPSGKRRALLIGCNYLGQRGELQGCADDVQTLTRLLNVTYGWDLSNIRQMTDFTRGSEPTKANILSAIGWLVKDNQPGDCLFFSFSGHGGQQPDPLKLEEDGMNETLLGLDYQRGGTITDDELNRHLIQTLNQGVKLTMVLDACHSGSGADLSYTHTFNGWKEETNPFHIIADVQMFSGCTDEGVSADGGGRLKGGAMTNALSSVCAVAPNLPYTQLLASIHQTLQKYQYCQRPVLTSSQAFDYRRPFNPNGDILPNTNQVLGRIVRRYFEPRPNKHTKKQMKKLGIESMMAGAAMGVMGMALLDALF